MDGCKTADLLTILTCQANTQPGWFEMSGKERNLEEYQSKDE